VSLVKSSIGRKMIMGICGGVWAGFVFGHMAGNMLIFVSPEMYNKYGHAIVSNKPLLYATEAILLGTIIFHVILGALLTWRNKTARTQKYAMTPSGEKRASLGSRSMIFHGSILLFFIVYHLMTFKYGTHYSVTYDGVEMRDLSRLVVEVFQDPLYVVGYILCLLLLGWHLSHGVSSLFQSLGLNHPSYTPKIKCASWIYAVVVTAGFISQPIYAMLNS
jgi:succinate dehydrogenase / fumarate reductase, cytochrome b subunit